MFTVPQLLCHFIADFVLQSDWMALEKTKRWWPCVVHVLIYGTVFLILQPSLLAWIVIVGTHFAIDHWRLARFVVYVKNFMSPRSEWQPWEQCWRTGFPAATPEWLALWLMIAVDQLMHILINGAALAWL